MMIAAMVLAVGVMLVRRRRSGDFVNRHPTMKMLALSFLILIGVLLIADAFGQHIAKRLHLLRDGVLAVVEMINLRFRKKTRAASANLSGARGRDTRVAMLRNTNSWLVSSCSQLATANARAAEESSSEEAPFAGGGSKAPAPFAASPSAGFARARAVGAVAADDR